MLDNVSHVLGNFPLHWALVGTNVITNEEGFQLTLTASNGQEGIVSPEVVDVLLGKSWNRFKDLCLGARI